MPTHDAQDHERCTGLPLIAAVVKAFNPEFSIAHSKPFSRLRLQHLVDLFECPTFRQGGFGCRHFTEAKVARNSARCRHAQSRQTVPTDARVDAVHLRATRRAVIVRVLRFHPNRRGVGYTSLASTAFIWRERGGSIALERY